MIYRKIIYADDIEKKLHDFVLFVRKAIVFMFHLPKN